MAKNLMEDVYLSSGVHVSVGFDESSPKGGVIRFHKNSSRLLNDGFNILIEELKREECLAFAKAIVEIDLKKKNERMKELEKDDGKQVKRDWSLRDKK